MTIFKENDGAVAFESGGVELFRYVYRPDTPQLESPRPYMHPVRTLRGDVVSLYRPHDHLWHKGISLALPNVGEANFWGGPTFVRDKGYQQLPNNGTQRHDGFEPLDDRIDERLSWITEQGEHWMDERRTIVPRVLTDDAWDFTFETALTNRRDVPIRFGSPTTEGRPDAGYGGLFWRGPRSFTGGTVLASEGGGEMGERGRWLAFVGRHDEVDRASTIVFVDSKHNPRHPTKWFVRSVPYACISPAPFFDEEMELAAGATLTLGYEVIVGSGAWDHDRISAVV